MTSEERMRALEALEWIFKVADDHGKYTCSDEYELVKSALHSVEAEKDPEWHKADGSTPVAPVWADQDLMWAWKPARGPKKDGQIIMICIQDLGAPWEYAFIRRPAPPRA